MKEEFLSATREKLQECLRLFQKTAEYEQLYDACTTLLQVSHGNVLISVIIAVFLFIISLYFYIISVLVLEFLVIISF